MPILATLPHFLHSSDEQLVCAYGVFDLFLSTTSMKASLSDFSVNLKLMSSILISLSTSASAMCLRVSFPVQCAAVPSAIKMFHVRTHDYYLIVYYLDQSYLTLPEVDGC